MFNQKMIKNFFKSNFLTLSEVESARKEFINNPGLERIEELGTFLNYKLGNIIFNNKLKSLIKKELNLKDFIFLDVVKIFKRSSCVKMDTGWHHDYGGLEDQLEILSKHKNFIYKIGLYLQDNKKNFGGGIDLLKPMLFDNLKKNNFLMKFLRKLYYFILIRFSDNTVETSKGDVVSFSGLTYHRTSPVKFINHDNEEIRYHLYFIITNIETVNDAIRYHDDKFNDYKIKNLNQNIERKKFDNVDISILNKEYSRIVERILGDKI